MTNISTKAAFFLVLLRLAIGWHFLVEGFQKIPSDQLSLLGIHVNHKPFSSSAYFREATGPLGQGVRWLAGDPDQDARSRLVGPADGGPPPALDRDWKEYLRQFSAHYALTEQQKAEADTVYEAAVAKAVAILTYAADADAEKRDKDPNYTAYTTEQTRTYPSGEAKRRMTMRERIAEYEAKLAELADTQNRKLWLFGRDVEGARLRTQKAEIAQLRAGLLTDVDKLTQAYKDDLDKLLTKEQKDRPAVTLEKPRSVVTFIDDVTPWMLTGIGAFLVFGLFSRLAAALGALFLLMTYLATPALPWLPAVGPSESTSGYLFVNKNVVEMLALFALACLPTGRWFGADGLLYAVFGPLFPTKRKAS